MSLSVRVSGCVIYDLLVQESWFVLTVSALTFDSLVTDFVYCVGVNKYVIVGNCVGLCDIQFVGTGILVCFNRVGTNRYCH